LNKDGGQEVAMNQAGVAASYMIADWGGSWGG